MKEDIPDGLFVGREHVRRVRAFCRIREGMKEGRREGFFAYLRIRPVHSAAFDTPSFIVARPFLNAFPFLFPVSPFLFFFFFFFFKDETGTEAEDDYLFQHTGTERRRHAHTTAGRRHTFYPSVQSCIHRVREGERTGRVCAYHIYPPSSSSAKQAKQRKTENWRKKKKKKKRRKTQNLEIP